MALSQLELAQRPFIELQIEAIAVENHIKPLRVQKFIDSLEARILEIKNLSYNKLLNKSLRLPLINRPNSFNDEDYPKVFKFLPPRSMQTIGGFKTKTALKRTNYVDLAVQMPGECFEKKDIKNQRYHHKRALYLAQIAQLLKGATGFGLVEKLEYRFHQGDYLKPVIIITPRQPNLKKSNIMFQMFAIPDPEFAIKLSMLNPLHGNVAPKWFFQNYDLTTSDEELERFILSDSDVAPSPYYNSSILFDIEAVVNSDVISDHVIQGTSISEALILLKIWLFQRDLHHHFSFIMSMFVAYMQSKRKIHQNMSSYQIFKMVIKTLVEQDWAASGLSFFEAGESKIADFKSVFPVVFLSPSGYLNLCYKITGDLYNRLRHEAGLASVIINTGSPDTFDLLFLKKIDFIGKFDVILPECRLRFLESIEFMKAYMDVGVLTPRVFARTILDLVSKSLTDRVTLVQLNPTQLTSDEKWSLNSPPNDPKKDDDVTMSLGLLLDAEKSLRVIDVGPDAQSPEAEEFRNFWDPKSELRLQNGVISETVVWHVDSFAQRRSIIKYILTHALKKVNLSNVTVHYTLLERFIELKNVQFTWRDDHTDAMIENGLHKRKNGDDCEVYEQNGKPIGVGEETFQKLAHSYNEINKVMRNIDKLKHSITSVQPVSHHLRSSGVFPPLPVNLQQRNKSLKRRKGVTLFPEDFNQIGKVLHIEPVEILVTLDSTSKWPADFEALEAEKLDYLIQMGEALRAKEYCVKFAEDFLDVLQGQFIFRIRVRCQKELSLVSGARGKLELQKRKLDHEILPRLHGALDQLYHQKPAFSLTCRVVKRWISCQLMTNRINDIALDLIVAHLFLHPQPVTEPASSLCGFRRFIHLFATHNWEEEPLIVNFDNQLKVDELTSIRSAMQKDRAKYPKIVICTPFDREKLSPWTQDEPSVASFELLHKTCSKAVEYLTNDILLKVKVVDECRALFRPNFKFFDLIIKLDPQVVQSFFMSIDPPKSYTIRGREPNVKQASAFTVMPIVGLNVVEQFVGLLRDKFNDLASFYHDRYGQRVIGVIMKPESEKLLNGDMNAFIRKIRKIGAKLVESVSLKKNK